MTHPIIQAIINSLNDWGGWDHQNSQLELASLCLEAKFAGLDISPIKPYYELLINSTRTKPGHFRRSPNDPIANSHDNLIGLAVLSYLFDNGEIAREILANTEYGLWITGKNEHGHLIDSEWFSLLRPEYRSLVKIAAGRKINVLEKLMLVLSLDFNKVFNTKRVKLLFLHAAGVKFSALPRIVKELGDKYKGRYLSDYNSPTLWIYQALWALNGSKTLF